MRATTTLSATESAVLAAEINGKYSALTKRNVAFLTKLGLYDEWLSLMVERGNSHKRIVRVLQSDCSFGLFLERSFGKRYAMEFLLSVRMEGAL